MLFFFSFSSSSTNCNCVSHKKKTIKFITIHFKGLVVEASSSAHDERNLKMRICDFMPSLQLKVRKCVKTQELFRRSS